jgi:aspartyl-tRNA(Asn)/glutamyl-tRNA(Gln) amidotransferase subunit C
VKITREELAYLDLSEDELEKYRRQLDEILTYIGKLNELDTSGVAPMAQVLADDQTADATLREDLVVPSAVADDVLRQAPDPEPPYFRVPKVLER